MSSRKLSIDPSSRSKLILGGIALIAALAFLSGCGRSGHAPTYLDANGKSETFWDWRLTKMCQSDKLVINVNSELVDTLGKLDQNDPTWVVRTVLVSDSFAANTTTPRNDVIYTQLPVQNTAKQLQTANAATLNSPSIMHVTMDCQNRTATYFGPGVSSPNGITGLIKEPDDKAIDDVGDLTIRNLFISDGYDQVVNAQGQTVEMPVNIHVYKDEVLAVDTGGDQGQQQRAADDAKYGIRKYKVTLRQKTAVGVRKLVIVQTVNLPTDTAIKVDADVAANYLAVLPQSYVVQVMAKSSDPQTQRLARMFMRGPQGINALRAMGKTKIPVDFNILNTARQAMVLPKYGYVSGPISPSMSATTVSTAPTVPAALAAVPAAPAATSASAPETNLAPVVVTATKMNSAPQ